METDSLKEKFIQHFSSISPLSQEESDAIRRSMRLLTSSKGTMLLREGQVQVDTYFILQGCVREYMLLDGEEKTTNFYTEGQWVISLNNFGSPAPSQHHLICTEDSVLSVGNEEQAQLMFKQFPRFETISRAVLETYFTKQRELLTSFLTDSPEVRYQKLLNTRPDLLQRVPQYQLASYIGVAPESLSRIRKRLLGK